MVGSPSGSVFFSGGGEASPGGIISGIRECAAQQGLVFRVKTVELDIVFGL